LEQYQRAIEDFDKAIRLKSHLAESYYSRGYAYARLGQYKRAIMDYDQAIRLKSDYVEAFSFRVEAYFKLGQYQQVIKDLARLSGFGGYVERKSL